jgi:hypothetical protein
VQLATDLDDLVRIVSAYLAAWRAEDVRLMPAEISVLALRSAEEIPLRAVTAAQVELKADARNPGASLLREMSLTMMAAASRLRFLGALRAKESGK